MYTCTVDIDLGVLRHFVVGPYWLQGQSRHGSGCLCQCACLAQNPEKGSWRWSSPGIQSHG